MSTFKLFAPVFYLLYFLIVFIWPSVRIYRQTGINPVTFGTTDTAHDFIGRWFKLLLGVVAVVAVVYSSSGKFYAYLLPIDYLAFPALQWSGVLLCTASLVWIALAQWQMGCSWRIGLAEKHRTALRTEGLFSLSRNPIFLGMMATLVGVFFLLPNAITLLILFSGYLLLQIVARLEEAFLQQQYGVAYSRYKESVRRWI